MLADLYAYLTTAPAVGFDATRAAALTSLQALISTRVFPDFLAERAQMPALTYQLIDNRHDYTLEAVPVDLDYPRVQVDVYSNDAVQRESISGYVKTALDGYQGTMGGTEVAVVLFDNELNDFSSEPLQYRKTLDFKVIHYT